jgi:hypothetical protein
MTAMGTNILRTDKECGMLLRSDGFNINRINWKEKVNSFNFIN